MCFDNETALQAVENEEDFARSGIHFINGVPDRSSSHARPERAVRMIDEGASALIIDGCLDAKHYDSAAELFCSFSNDKLGGKPLVNACDVDGLLYASLMYVKLEKKIKGQVV